MTTAATTVQECMQEIIAKGSGYFIRSSVPGGSRAATEWEPTSLLADMRQNAPGILDDLAWTEWSDRSLIGTSCFIHYGSRGSSLAHQEVPSYGHLRAFELSQKRLASSATSANGARTPLIHLLGY